VLRQRIVDTVEHGVRLRQHIVVPETRDAPTVAFEEASTYVIVSGVLDMLTSVELDHETSAQTCEIYEERPNRMLPAELEPGDAAISQVSPQQSFGIGLLPTKFARPRCCASPHSPHPSPLPKIGERECLRATARALSVFRPNA